MSRALLVTIATLLAAPALADEPAPKPAPKTAPAASGDPAAPTADSSAERSPTPVGRAPDLRANPRTGKPKDAAARSSGEAKGKAPVDAPAAKPAPCVEVKPCSID